MKLLKAASIAEEMVEILRPHSKIINIAGSIRREKPEVKDIEIVCSPKRIYQPTLFGNSKCYTADCFKSAIQAVPGKILKGQSGGRYLQIKLDKGINLDLFLPQDEDYYRQYATRTGSGEYSRIILAQSWNRKGWVGTPDGLRRMEYCSRLYEDKNIWRCYMPDPEMPTVWQSEEEFFDWLNLKWIAPKYRNV